MAYTPVATRTGTAGGTAYKPAVSSPVGGSYTPVAQRSQAPTPPAVPYKDSPIAAFGPDAPAPSFAMKDSTLAVGGTGGQNFNPVDFAASVGQSIARSAASTALTIAKKINPEADSFKPEDFHNFFTQALVENIFGKDPNKSIEERIVEAEPKLKAWGDDLATLSKEPTLNTRERLVTKALSYLASNHPTSLAFSGIMGSIGMDLTPFGGAEEGAYKALVAAKNEGEALMTLSKMGVADDIARQFTSDVVKVATEKDAKSLFSSIARLQATTKPLATEAAKAAYTPVAERATKIAEEVPGVRVAEDTLPKVFHGTDADFKDFENRFLGSANGTAPINRTGFSFTDNPEVAKTFGKNLKEVAVDIKKPYIVDAAGKDYAEFKDILNESLSKIDKAKYDGVIIKNYKDAGKYGQPTIASDHYIPFKESQIKPVVQAGRVNTKLEKMATESPTFADFYQRAGVTMDALNMTAKKKGFTNAADFYAHNKAVPTTQDASRAAETASLERSAQMATRVPVDELPELPRLSAGDLRTKTEEAKAALEEARVNRDVGREVVTEMPGRLLRNYASPDTGELPEVIGGGRTLRGVKIKEGGKFAKSGDVIVQDLGFRDLDEANDALQAYKATRKQLNEAEASVSARVKDYRNRKAVFDEVVRYVKQEGNARREKVKLVEDFFKLSKSDVKDLLKGERDVRLMTDGEFDDFLKRFEGKATEMYLGMADRAELEATIFEKEFVKLDNLRKAMKLPTIENMSPAQMRQFNETLQEFKVGDEFLGVRQLETVKNTDLKGIHTIREATEHLLGDINKLRERKGLKPATLDELRQVKPTWTDHFKYDVALARKNSLYDLMVHETHKSILNADAEVLEVKDKVDELMSAARKSRARPFLDKLIPTDKRIFQWLEAPEAQKILLAKDLTKEELDAAMYVRAWYAEARDYLIQQQTLKRYISDYVTHIRRGFLESWRESAKTFVPGAKKAGVLKRTGTGLLAAFKEAMAAYKDEEAFFNIMNDKTGDVLPLEKFFQFSLKRNGQLVPTQNVASAFLKYVATFEKKKALDGLIPKLDIYVHSLTPKKMTPRGLEFDDSLKTFFNNWMNTKKGRVMALGPLKPGNPLDWAMRTGVALTRLLDLGLSVPVGIASNIGAQAAVYRGLGEKAYLLGTARGTTKQGKEILKKYRNLVGESSYKKMRSADASLGDNIMQGVFGLFSFADRKARETFLLGSMTPAEYKAGAVSADRLTDIKLDLGRHMPVENMQSTMGKTAIGKVGTQYKTWAVPLLSSTLDDLTKLKDAVRTGDKAYLKSKEFAELMRTTILSAVIGLGVYGTVTDKTPMKDKSFIDKLASKAAQDSLSLVGALDPSFWSATPRLMQFLNDFSTDIKQIVTVEKNKSDELTGVNTLERTLVPGVVKQAIGPAESLVAKKKPTSGLPPLPPLPKLPKLPPLPKLPKL